MTNQIQNQPRRTVDLRIPAIEKYAYCLCLHVKPTTIFIAVFKLIRSLLFASILLNTEFTLNEHTEFLTLDERHRSTAIAVSIFSRIIIASVSALAIYAVVSGRAALLMPLYAVLLVDFFFALPAFYNRDLADPSLADTINDLKNYPHRENQLPRFSLMLISVITMIARIYFLCVIWKCYRYLRLIELIAPIRLSEVYPHLAQNIQYPVVRVLGSTDSTDLGPGCGSLAPPSYDSIAASMKPPNYEEAIKTSEILPSSTPSLQQQGHVNQSASSLKDPATTPNLRQQQSNQVISATEDPLNVTQMSVNSTLTDTTKTDNIGSGVDNTRIVLDGKSVIPIIESYIETSEDSANHARTNMSTGDLNGMPSQANSNCDSGHNLEESQNSKE